MTPTFPQICCLPKKIQKEHEHISTSQPTKPLIKDSNYRIGIQTPPVALPLGSYGWIHRVWYESAELRDALS